MSFKHRIITFFVTFGYFGYSPYIPGTIGTLGGVLIFYLLSNYYLYYIGVILIILVLGIWLSGIAEKDIFKTKDSQKIVIDEVAGFLISMISFTTEDHWGFILLGFIFFRIFDIVKPYPIKQIQGLEGGIGIMADDILAGIYTNLLLQITRLVVISYFV